MIVTSTTVRMVGFVWTVSMPILVPVHKHLRALTVKLILMNAHSVRKSVRMVQHVQIHMGHIIVFVSMDGLDMTAQRILMIVREPHVSTVRLATIELVPSTASVHQEKLGSCVISQMPVHPIHVMKGHSVRQVQLTEAIYAVVQVDSRELIARLISMNVLKAHLVSIMASVSILQEAIVAPV